MGGKTNRYQTIALSLVFLLNITTFFYLISKTGMMMGLLQNIRKQLMPGVIRK